jgi:hypothetical protein
MRVQVHETLRCAERQTVGGGHRAYPASGDV